MIWSSLEKHRDAGLLILRIGFGLGFLFFHGWSKLIAGPERWKGVGSAIQNVGIDFGHTFFGFMAAFSESVGGLMIAFGFLFRVACVLLFITMSVASLNHIVTGQGSPSHSLKNASVFLGILFVGPGKYSVDGWLERRRGAGDDV